MYGITFVLIACKDWKVSISYVLILTFIDRAKRGQEILKINPFSQGVRFTRVRVDDWKKWSKIKGKSDFFQVSGGFELMGLCCMLIYSRTLCNGIFYGVHYICKTESWGRSWIAKWKIWLLWQLIFSSIFLSWIASAVFIFVCFVRININIKYSIVKILCCN